MKNRILLFIFLLLAVQMNAQTNLLTNPGFDEPIQPLNGNNFTFSYTFNGWTMTGGPFNVIQPNGSYSAGPDNAQNGSQYIEVYYASGTVYQDFTISDVCAQTVSFGGYFSSRTGQASGLPARIAIFSVSTGAEVATTNTKIFGSASDIKTWFYLFGTVSLPLGNYRYIAYIDDDANFDAAFVKGTGCVWDGSTGDWSDGTKWSCGHPPSSTENVTISGGVVNIDVANSSIANLNMCGGTLTGNNNISVQGVFTWGGGSISGTGTMTVEGATTITFASNTPTLDTRSLTLNGGGTITDGFNTSNGANLIIPFGKTLTWTNSSNLSWGGNGGILTIAGTLIKNGTGTLECGYQNFQNTGTVNINAGGLRIGFGGTHNGATFNVASNTSLTVSSGSHSFTEMYFYWNRWLRTH